MGELLEQLVVPLGATIFSFAGSGLATSVMWICEPSRDPTDQATVVPSEEIATPPGILARPAPSPRWAVAGRVAIRQRAAAAMDRQAGRTEIFMPESLARRADDRGRRAGAVDLVQLLHQERLIVGAVFHFLHLVSVDLHRFADLD